MCVCDVIKMKSEQVPGKIKDLAIPEGGKKENKFMEKEGISNTQSSGLVITLGDEIWKGIGFGV